MSGGSLCRVNNQKPPEIASQHLEVVLTQVEVLNVEAIPVRPSYILLQGRAILCRRICTTLAAKERLGRSALMAEDRVLDLTDHLGVPSTRQLRVHPGSTAGEDLRAPLRIVELTPGRRTMPEKGNAR